MENTGTQNGKSPVAAADALLRPVIREKSTYVPHYPSEEFIVPLLRREIESCIARYATPLRGAGKAADIGCGGQPFRALLEGIGYSYCGIDVNPQGIKVDFQCAADEPLPEDLVRRAPFDFLLCTEVIEHVVDWHTVFANFKLLLAPGGRALITAPHFYLLHEEPYDFWRPTLHVIDHYARRTGLQPLYRKAAGDAWDILGTMLASCRFAASSGRVVDRALAKAIRVSAGLTSRALIRRRIQRSVRVEGPLYLSNVVVLEKPELE